MKNENRVAKMKWKSEFGKSKNRNSEIRNQVLDLSTKSEIEIGNTKTEIRKSRETKIIKTKLKIRKIKIRNRKRKSSSRNEM